MFWGGQLSAEKPSVVQQVDNSYDYIDFRTFLPPMAGFEPCEIMPGGDGCECLNLGCTDEEASGRGVVTQFASPAACGALGYGEGGGGGRTEGQKRALTLVCALLPNFLCRS